MDPQANTKGEHYNLRWNNYTANLVEVFSQHQHQATLVDVTLICEGQYIKAHKLILSACSGFFQNMFTIDANMPHPYIFLNGIKFKHFRHIIEFIYHGEIKILDVDLEGVLSLGETLQIKGLCAVKLKQQVSETPRSVPLKTNSEVNNSQLLEKTLPQNDVKIEQNQLKQIGQTSKDVKRLEAVSNKIVAGSGKKAQSNQNQTRKENVTNKRTMMPEVTRTNDNSNDSVENWRENKQDGDKIPRPANAFMIFANEWRKKLTVENPGENNKGISVRLGNMWKSLNLETKESYYLAAEKAQLEHELKYPRYSYDPMEPKKRKLSRRKTIDSVAQLATVDLLEFDDDDDLQIIEINEDPIDISKLPDKRQRS